MSDASFTSDSHAVRVGAPFGDVAVAKGFVTAEQVHKGLDIQAELSREGIQKRLGDILVEQGFLLPHQLKAVLSEQAQAETRTTIQNYELLEKLGEGGMGMVLKARRLNDGRLVALKLLFKRLAADEQFIERFHREARIGLTLDHPNLVKCLEVGDSDGTHFMALEYVDGDDLGKALQRRSFFPEGQALAIVLAAARGMSYAHAKGLVHRDVKPANIILTREGQVKVMDFGLARQEVESDQSLTLPGVVMGTPHYIAPEQVEGKEKLDGRSDIYSLGVTLFHMLAGRPPFIGGNLYDVLNCHITRRVPDPRQYNKGISRETAELLLWMCAREREKRPASMDRVAEEISRAMGFPSAEAAASASQPHLLATQQPPPPLPLPPSQQPSTRKALSSILKQLRCPRCRGSFSGDPALVAKDERIRCPSCGLVYLAPLSAPEPPPILPDEIQLESPEENDPRPPLEPAGAPPEETVPAEGLSLKAGAPRKMEPPAVPKKPWTMGRILKSGMGGLAAAAILGLAAWLCYLLLSGKFDAYFQ